MRVVLAIGAPHCVPPTLKFSRLPKWSRNALTLRCGRYPVQVGVTSRLRSGGRIRERRGALAVRGERALSYDRPALRVNAMLSSRLKASAGFCFLDRPRDARLEHERHVTRTPFIVTSLRGLERLYSLRTNSGRGSRPPRAWTQIGSTVPADAASTHGRKRGSNGAMG